MWAIESDRQKKEAIFAAASTNFNNISTYNQSRIDNNSQMDKGKDAKKLQNLFRQDKERNKNATSLG